jgi:hypothetical protein
MGQRKLIDRKWGNPNIRTSTSRLSSGAGGTPENRRYYKSASNSHVKPMVSYLVGFLVTARHYFSTDLLGGLYLHVCTVQSV